MQLNEFEISFSVWFVILGDGYKFVFLIQGFGGFYIKKKVLEVFY